MFVQVFYFAKYIFYEEDNVMWQIKLYCHREDKSNTNMTLP